MNRDLYAASYIATKELKRGFGLSYVFVHNVCIFPAVSREEAIGVAIEKSKEEFPPEEGYGDHDAVVLPFQKWVDAYGKK